MSGHAANPDEDVLRQSLKDAPSLPHLTPDPCPLTPSSLTPLDQTLLTHIFTGQGQPLTLALSMGMSLADFLAWHTSPKIQQAVADLEAIQNQAARRTIITELEALVRTTPDPIETRRAASTLLRAINPPHPRIAALQSTAGASRIRNTGYSANVRCCASPFANVTSVLSAAESAHITPPSNCASRPDRLITCPQSTAHTTR